jgi:hypothetical protein
MNIKESSKNKLSILIILIWPYIFLFPLTFGFLVMGNDFDLIYFSYKRYIAEMLSVGVIPLWSPADGTGFSLIYNPFAQYFYLPGWINYLVHFFTKNLSLHFFLIYTIFAISIFSLGIFVWLKSLNIDHGIAFLSALLVACSLKITELLRFPNAAHAAAWFPWVLYGINLMIKENNKKSFIIIFFSNLFILTAGYPYFIIYSLFLFIPYILFVPILTNTYQNINYEFLKFYLSILITFMLSYLLALPWLLKVKLLMKNVVDRTENNWEFATEHSFNIKDTIGSWIFPPASSTEGWYYFGIIVTIIIFFGFIIFCTDRKFFDKAEKKLFIFSILFIFFITYFSWGKESLLFYWSWNNLPIIGSLRSWPRINIVIVPFIILLFSISLGLFINFLQSNDKKSNLVKIIFSILIVTISLQFIFYFFEFQNNDYWDFWQKKRFDAAIANSPLIIANILKLYDGPIYLIFNLLASLTLLFLIKKNLYKNLVVINLIIFFFVIAELFVISNLQWSLDQWKSKLNLTNKPLKQLQNGFNSKRIVDTVKGSEYFRDNRFFNVNYPDNYGYDSHAKNFTMYFQRYEGRKNPKVSDEDFELAKFFYGATEEGKKIFFSQKIDHSNIVSFVKESNDFEKVSKFEIDVLIDKYDGNYLELNIKSKNDGWVSFIDNWDSGWISSVNGENKEIYKLLGSYKSIKIKKGFSNIKFQYKPW